MAALDEPMREVAEALLEEFGAAAVLHRRNTSYSLESGEETVALPESWPVQIVPPGYMKREKRGSTVTTKTFDTYVAALGLAGSEQDGSELAPAVGMFLEYQGTRHKVVDAKVIGGDLAIIHWLKCEL